MVITKKYDIPFAGDFDIIVAGGGVAGVAAAVSAARENKKVLIIEKQTMLGGLATSGLITYFVPMCNGRGTQIMKGMADEFLKMATTYGFDDIAPEWKGEAPFSDPPKRLKSHYDTGMFALALNKLVANYNVKVMYDSVITDVVMDGNACKGLIVDNKSGKSYYSAKIIIDVTGDADVLHLAGVPCVQGKNYFTSVMHSISLEGCKKALDDNNIGKAIKWIYGGPASLMGKKHPSDKPFYCGTTGDNVSEFIVENQLYAFDKYKDTDRMSMAIVAMPSMAQFRTTRHIIGDYTLTTNDIFKHFDDSVTALCDMDHRDFLYEIPYRCLCRSDYPNILTAGRCISADGYAWDVSRVIPPAIITGQAAGKAASIAIDDRCDVSQIQINRLQNILDGENVMIHFDDSLVPAEPIYYEENIDHI